MRDELSIVQNHITRLRLTTLKGFTAEDISAVERASGLSIEEPTRTFLCTVGACESPVRIGEGGEAGRILHFLEVSRVIEYITEDIGRHKVVPFATCLMGDLICLVERDGLQEVVAADLANERTVSVAGSFEAFLEKLAPC